MNDTKEDEQESAEVDEVDIHISNIMCDFLTRCHLNLRQIANNGSNVVHKREQGAVFMRIRNPQATATIRSSGHITVTGSTSDEDAKKACRRVARCLQKLGFNVRMRRFRITNVLGNVTLPFGIKLAPFTENHPKICSYEPELHPGAIYKWKDPKATFTIFQTGSISITAPSVAAIDAAVQHIYPLVYEFRKEKPKEPILPLPVKGHKRKGRETHGQHGHSDNPRKTKKRRRDWEDDEDDDSLSDFINDDNEECDPLTEEEEATFTNEDEDE